MQLTIHLKDLGYVILFFLALGIGAYLIIMIKNINLFVRELRETFHKSRKNIEETARELPEIADNLKKTSIDLRAGAQRTEKTLEVLSENITEAAVTVNRTADSITTYSVLITEIVKGMMEVFGKDK